MISNSTTPPTTPMNPAARPSLGQVGYDAYGDRPGAHGPWRTFNGHDMPRWHKLEGESGELTCDRWQAAANAILNAGLRRRAATFADEALKLVGGDGRFHASYDAAAETIALAMDEGWPVAHVDAELLIVAEELRTGGAVELCLARLHLPPSGHRWGEALLAQGEARASAECVDSFLAGLSEISSATRDLAEASAESARARAVGADTSALEALITTSTEQLHARVKLLATPPTEG